jgi:adenosine deaminase
MLIFAPPIERITMTLQRVFFTLTVLTCSFVNAQKLPARLQEKLNAQWELYEKAQTTLLQYAQRTDIPTDQRTISRENWEDLLALKGRLAFTKQNIIELQNNQKLRIQMAKNLAQKNSLIDLDKIREQKISRKFCEQFPKGGMLHVHPSGTIDQTTANSLLNVLNPKIETKELLQEIDNSNGNSMLYAQERTWLQHIPAETRYLSLSNKDQNQFQSFLFLPPGKHPFSRFNGVFEFLGFVIPDWDSYDNALFNFAQKAINEGVIYVELTTSAGPSLFTHIATLEQRTGLIIRINKSFDRTKSLANLDQSLSNFLAETTTKYLVGIDFLDDEAKNPAFEKGQLLYGSILHANHSGKTRLHRTMHAGEIGDIRNPRDAMILGAERLGHGVNLAKNPVALEFAVRIHEPVEINLSSNLRLTDILSISNHPFLNYLRLGLPISLSTDDEGIFETDINHECEIAINDTDITYIELKQMAFNSIQTSFASVDDKKILLELLSKKFMVFENNLRRNE